MNIGLDLRSQPAILEPSQKVRQALDILTLNSQELVKYIEGLLENIFANGSENTMGIKRNKSKKEYYNNRFFYTNTDDDDETPEHSDNYIPGNVFLKEYLSFQLHTSVLNKKEMLIGEYIIENIDKNGYFNADLKEVADLFQTLEEEVEKVLYTIHTFDPPGIGARNLIECILIQLSHNDINDPDVIRAVKYHLSDFAFPDYDRISKTMNINKNRVLEIQKIIRSLEPKPGRAFHSCEETRYIVPDILVEEHKGKYKPILNKDILPLLDINNYLNKLKTNRMEATSRSCMNKYNELICWLSKCIEQRKNILMRIARYLINHQQNFFTHGLNHFVRIPIDKAEQDLNLSRSIIHRTICNKYLKCRHGIYEIRDFFSKGQ